MAGSANAAEVEWDSKLEGVWAATNIDGQSVPSGGAIRPGIFGSVEFSNPSDAAHIPLVNSDWFSEI